MDKISKVEGVILSPLKVIEVEKGNVMHALKSTDAEYKAFGEAYFSTVNFNQVKGWKAHQKMIMNLIVPTGEVQFALFDDRPDSNSYKQFFTVNLSLKNYQRLTVPPKVWMAFKGIGKDLNLLLNIASIPHDPTEAKTVDLEKIPFSWI